jgi:hypothetical protein
LPAGKDLLKPYLAVDCDANQVEPANVRLNSVTLLNTTLLVSYADIPATDTSLTLVEPVQFTTSLNVGLEEKEVGVDILAL